MTQWQRTLHLEDLWKQREDEEISVAELAGGVAKRLTSLRNFNDISLDAAKTELVHQFEDLAECDDTDVENFDYVLADLYDWADTALDTHWNGKKVCWVKTF